MSYQFEEKSKEKIINKFGIEFLKKIEGLIDPVTLKWGISDLNLIQSFSANLVFKGDSDTFGPVVIKFARNENEFNSEVAALKFFDKKSVCRLFEVDEKNLVLMEECIEPGVILKDEKNMAKRLAVFCDLYKTLHHEKDCKEDDLLKDHTYSFKTYEDWVFKITDYMNKKVGWQEVTEHMNRAKELFKELSLEYPSQRLLHGDFHYYNILSSGGGYKIIDPKGVLGNPIFDIPRFMLNEFWDEEEDDKVNTTMEKVFYVFSNQLEIPKNVLSKLLYIEGTMANCWNIEDGATMDQKEDILDTINWLEIFM